MEDNKKPLNSKKIIVRIIIIQFLIFIAIVLFDLYAFRGFFTSKIHINPDPWGSEQTYSCDFSIEKTKKNNYLFSFKNQSLFPKYFINYRWREYSQSITDSVFFRYDRKNLHPNFGFDYSYSFDCGTGLGLSSINPLESFTIEKSYLQIIEESSYMSLFRKSNFLYKNIKKKYIDLNHKQLDSIIRTDIKLISETDSIEIEYYIMMNSFLSKKDIYTTSNKIKVSLKDLLNKYIERQKKLINTSFSL